MSVCACACVQVFRRVSLPSLRSRRRRRWRRRRVDRRRRPTTASAGSRSARLVAEDRRSVTAATGLAGHGVHQPGKCGLRVYARQSGTHRIQERWDPQGPGHYIHHAAISVARMRQPLTSNLTPVSRQHQLLAFLRGFTYSPYYRVSTSLSADGDRHQSPGL